MISISSRTRFLPGWALVAAAATLASGCPQSPQPWGPKPPGSNGPAAKLASGDRFRGVIPTGLANTAIGVASASADSSVAQLVLVGLDAARKAKPETILADASDADSVRVSLTAPHAALFLRSPNADGIGTLSQAALDTGTVTAVPSGSGVPAEGFWLGAAGNEILYTATYSTETRRGVLHWSDGKTTNQLAEDTIPAAVLFSQDRGVALVAAEVTPAGTGKLLAITMKGGGVTELAAGVPLVAADLSPRFALSADGTTAAWVNTSGAVVKMATAGGTPSDLASAGDLPALSPDGKTAAWWEAAGLVMLSEGSAAQTVAKDAVSTVPARFSDKGARLVYCTGVESRGGGNVGTCSVALPGGTAQEPVALGVGVALDSIRFSGDGARVAAVVGLADPTGVATYDGLGRLVSAGPDAAPPTQIASGVRAEDAVVFPVTGRFGVIADFKLTEGVGELFATDAAGAPVRLGAGVVPGSLAAARDFDSFVFISDAENDLLDGVWRLGTLRGSNPNGPARLLHDAALSATFSADGRVLAVIARGEDAGIWSYPAP